MRRKTRQRDAVGEALARAGRAIGVAEIHAAAARAVPRLGVATVYRAIKSLLDAGEIVAVAVPGGAPRYEVATLAERHHHHFHCRGCGRLFELEGCPPDLARLAPRGFRLEGHEVMLYGRCKRCAA